MGSMRCTKSLGRSVHIGVAPMTITAIAGPGVASMDIASIAGLSISITLVIASISVVGVAWPAVAGVATMAISMMGVAWPAVAAVTVTVTAIPMTIADP